MDAECVADFVDGSLWVSYGDEIAVDGEVINEEVNEEAEVVEEVVE